MRKITDITGRLGNQMFQFAYIYALGLDGVLPDVYLQDPQYFDRHREEIKNLYGTDIINSDYIGIHVRREDYIGNDFYIDLLLTDYYEKAMKEFPGKRFMVFSDDIKYCQLLRIFENCEFSLENDEIKDLNSMAGCEGLIIANSSYSWWAAYLSNGKIIAPKEYYSDGIQRTKYPPEWKVI